MPRRSQQALIVLGAWTMLGLLIGEQTLLQLRLRDQTRPLLAVFGSPLVASWMWAAFTPLVVAATRRLRRLRGDGGAGGWARYLGWHLALAAALSVVGSTAWMFIRPWIDGVTQSWPVALANGIFFDVAAYVAVAALTEAITFAAEYRERDREAAQLARTAAELQERLDEARLHALETQLRPHFLYNTLNLIAELVHDEPDAADEMLTRLGLLLRRAYRASEHLVPLGEELAFVLAYAEILARRYRDRVTLAVDVPDALRDVPVPAFSLQPLVENAFRHGVERREARTAVEIVGQARDGALVLRVTDRATGTRRDAPPRRRWHPTAASGRAAACDAAGDGVGLRNTRERLRALYGSRASLALEHRAGETTATVCIPAEAPPALVAPPRARSLAGGPS